MKYAAVNIMLVTVITAQLFRLSKLEDGIDHHVVPLDAAK